MQGQSLGIFRSLGSLGRVVGPIYASLVYWKFGSVIAYLTGAILVVLPAMIVVADKWMEPKRLPSPFKAKGFRVISNDVLDFAHHWAKASIENAHSRLTAEDVAALVASGQAVPDIGTQSAITFAPPDLHLMEGA